MNAVLPTAYLVNAVLRTACSARAVLRTACSERVVLRTAVLCESCLTYGVLGESRLTYDVFGESCFTYDVLSESCLTYDVLSESCLKYGCARRYFSYVRRARDSCLTYGVNGSSCLTYGVPGELVKAIEDGRRTVGRVVFFREEPCTLFDVICNLTVTWLEFLCSFNARNYFILSPIAAVVSQRINQSCWWNQQLVDNRKAWLPIHITS